MASSNRHWPSLFKSKPCNSHNQWQHEINSSLISSTACQKTPYTSGCEERSPEPKPRWNPKPEQIRILESIFNSGLVNPPREEIRKIRAQLQEYGQVGDANVFYWFQNRKSRSKHKQRHHHHHHQHQPKPKLTTQQAPPLPTLTPAGIPLMLPTATSSSSSSSDKSSPGPTMIKTLGPTTTTTTTTNFIMEMSNSPTASVNQGFYQEDNNNNYYNQTPAAPTVAVQDPFYFQVQSGSPGFSQGSCWFSELSKMVQFAGQVQGSTHCSGLLMSELNACGGAGGELDGQEKMKLEQNQCYTINGMPEIGDSSAVATAGPPKLMVFINDVAFEVAVGPINVREAFGEGAVLYYSTGVPVPTNEWGLTLGALQHGSSYYLV